MEERDRRKGNKGVSWKVSFEAPYKVGMRRSSLLALPSGASACSATPPAQTYSKPAWDERNQVKEPHGTWLCREIHRTYICTGIPPDVSHTNDAQMIMMMASSYTP